MSTLTSKQFSQLNTDNLHSILCSSQGLATTCKEINFTVLDYTTGKLKWKAKNFKRDELNLKAPVDNTNVRETKENTFIMLTSFDHIYLYDIKVQRKPIKDFTTHLSQDYATEVMELSECDNYLTVANKIGKISILDLRKVKTPLKVLTDHFGSITDLKIDKDNDLYSG